MLYRREHQKFSIKPRRSLFEGLFYLGAEILFVMSPSVRLREKRSERKFQVSVSRPVMRTYYSLHNICVHLTENQSLLNTATVRIKYSPRSHCQNVCCYVAISFCQ
jgi:hypothetical protein